MYILSRAASVRNLTLSATNGLITLIILLIAPLGIAAVIINTALITVATYITATAADRVVCYLTSSTQQAELLSRANQSQIRRRETDDLDRR
jgi:hypothetical protein